MRPAPTTLELPDCREVCCCFDGILDSDGRLILDSDGRCIEDSQWEWFDLFEQESPLGAEWTEGNAFDPSGFEPLKLYDHGVVSDPYDTRGLLLGIGCAWRDLGVQDMEVEVVWAGFSLPEPSHTEGVPLTCVVPGTGTHGLGLAWPAEIFNLDCFLAGTIGNPVENFDVDAVSFFDHPIEGRLRRIKTRITARATEATLWLDGTQYPLSGLAFGNPDYGFDPMPVPAELQGSTRAGFAHDAHLVVPETNIPVTPSIKRWRARRIEHAGRDAFTGPDGTPLELHSPGIGEWDDSGTGVIEGGELYFTGGVAAVPAYMIGGAEGRLSVTVTAIELLGTAAFGFVQDSDLPGGGITIVYSGGFWSVACLSDIQIEDITIEVVVGDRFTLDVTATRIIAYANGIEVARINLDNPLSSTGRWSISADSENFRFDDWDLTLT
jgi:hypothetical protein